MERERIACSGEAECEAVGGDARHSKWDGTERGCEEQGATLVDGKGELGMSQYTGSRPSKDVQERLDARRASLLVIQRSLKARDLQRYESSR